jgi:hypothetical protein
VQVGGGTVVVVRSRRVGAAMVMQWCWGGDNVVVVKIFIFLQYLI